MKRSAARVGLCWHGRTVYQIAPPVTSLAPLLVRSQRKPPVLARRQAGDDARRVYELRLSGWRIRRGNDEFKEKRNELAKAKISLDEFGLNADGARGESRTRTSLDNGF